MEKIWMLLPELRGDKIGECYQSSRHLLTRYRRDIVLSMYVCSSSSSSMHWSDCAKKGKSVQKLVNEKWKSLKWTQ